MCNHKVLVGNVLIALGAGLLVSMLIPKSFWTVLIGVVLVVLGWILTSQTC